MKLDPLLMSSLLPPATGIPTRIGRLAVRDTGAAGSPGEVIVLWPSILADHRMYRVPIEAWRGRHRLVVIDGPGHGDSGPAPGPFTMAQCGQALGEVLDALGITRPVVIVGTSWGGLVAGEFALDQPHRTRAFFLPATRERGGPLLQDFHRHLREVDGAALAQPVRSVLIERGPLAPRMSRIGAPTLFLAGRQEGVTWHRCRPAPSEPSSPRGSRLTDRSAP